MRLVLFIMSLCLVFAMDDIIYKRIPKYNIIHVISDFFEQKQLYDCFKKQIDRNLLYLKCLNDGTVTDVVISIHDNIKKTAYV